MGLPHIYKSYWSVLSAENALLRYQPLGIKKRHLGMNGHTIN